MPNDPNRVEAIPTHYTGVAFSLHTCDVHGGHIWLSIYDDGVEVAGISLDERHLLTIARNGTLAAGELAEIVAAHKKAQQN